MTLISARRWRVELSDCSCGQHYIVVEPVVYVGKAEFRKFASAYRRLFINLERRWLWTKTFTNHTEAKSFAGALAKFVEEPAYIDNGQLCLVAPREAE